MSENTHVAFDIDLCRANPEAAAAFDGLCYVYVRDAVHIVRALPVQDREVVRADSGLRTGKTWRKGRVKFGYHTAEIAA